MRHPDAVPFTISTILDVLAVVLVVLTRMRLAQEGTQYGRGVSRTQATRTGPSGLLRAVGARR